MTNSQIVKLLHNMPMARMLLTTITKGGGSFLILQDVMGWATGFFYPFLGEGKQKTVSTSTDFNGPNNKIFLSFLS